MERYRTVSERYQNGIRTVQWNGTERYIRTEPFYHPFHHPNYDELPVISLLENNHLLKPNSIEPTIRQVCLLGRAPAGRSSNISHRRAPAAAAVVVVVVVVVFIRGPGEQDAHREYPAHERCPMEGRNDARWRGAAPSPPPHHRPASHRPSQCPPPRVASSFTTSSSSPPASSNLTTPQLIVNSPLYYCPHPHHRRCSYI